MPGMKAIACTLLTVALALALPMLIPGAARAQATLLNVSYDPTRELYAAINPLFAAAWKAQTGQALQIRTSHGGSGA